MLLLLYLNNQVSFILGPGINAEATSTALRHYKDYLNVTALLCWSCQPVLVIQLLFSA